jgi:hypothetical protein
MKGSNTSPVEVEYKPLTPGDRVISSYPTLTIHLETVFLLLRCCYSTEWVDQQKSDLFGVWEQLQTDATPADLERWISIWVFDLERRTDSGPVVPRSEERWHPWGRVHGCEAQTGVP